nr:MOSC domain-containing protein [Synergistales bacterium]
RALCVSKNKGTRKSDVGKATLVPGVGLEGDAHAGFMHRQVSLLNLEDIQEAALILPELGPGSFAENLTIEGFDLTSLRIGDLLEIGEAILEVTQIGKECHTRCEIYHKTGKCIMPEKGIFCRVLRGGEVRTGNLVRVADPDNCHRK